MAEAGWAVVFEGDRTEVEIAASMLRANGVQAETFSDTPYGDLMPGRILVPDDQEEEARRLLDEV